MGYILFFYCFFAYHIINNVIQKTIFHFYNDIKKTLSNDRKFYISKNISKSIILLLLCCYAYETVYNAIKLNKWNNIDIYKIGTLYASHDILSLFLAFKKLPFTTKLHHTSVLFLSYKNCLKPYGIIEA